MVRGQILTYKTFREFEGVWLPPFIKIHNFDFYYKIVIHFNNKKSTID